MTKNNWEHVKIASLNSTSRNTEQIINVTIKIRLENISRKWGNENSHRLRPRSVKLGETMLPRERKCNLQNDGILVF